MRVLSPILGLPSPKILLGEDKSPEHLAFEGHVDLILLFCTGLGEIKDFTLTGHTQNLMSTRTQVQSINLIEVWDIPLASLWRILRGIRTVVALLGTQTLTGGSHT